MKFFIGKIYYLFMFSGILRSHVYPPGTLGALAAREYAKRVGNDPAMPMFV